jgi:hypothetical protein
MHPPLAAQTFVYIKRYRRGCASAYQGGTESKEPRLISICILMSKLDPSVGYRLEL